MTITEDQKRALLKLEEALQQATDCDLLDALQGYVDYADSINDVCDAVDTLITEVAS